MLNRHDISDDLVLEYQFSEQHIVWTVTSAGEEMLAVGGSTCIAGHVLCRIWLSDQPQGLWEAWKYIYLNSPSMSLREVFHIEYEAEGEREQ